MGKKIFPKEIIENSSEANFSKHSLQTKLIYLIVLGALVAILVALPLIHVNVSIRSQGIIKPLTNRNQLVSLVSGNIDELYIEENASVVRGQIVAKISAPVLQEQTQFNSQRQQKIYQYISDLSSLLNMDASQFISTSTQNNAETPPLQSYKRQIERAVEEIESNTDSVDLQNARASLWSLLHKDVSAIVNTNSQNQTYKRSLSEFRTELNAPLQRIEYVQKTLDRHKILNGRGIISDATYQQSQSNLKEAWDNLLAIISNNSFTETTAPTTSNTNQFDEVPRINLRTPKYRSSLLEFKQQVRNNIQEIKRAQQKFNRNRQLFQRDVISEATFEQSSFALESARNDFQLLFDQQQNKWQADEVAYQDELDQLTSDSQQIEEKKDRYTIRAPISGTIQNMKGIYEGSPVSPNQALAEISPDTALIAECYLPPKDIGLLKEGMEVRFQISAFDYNQWGLLKGTVQEISNDVTVVNERPVFKVRSSLDQTWLELKNGYRGELKKGMSLQARFQVTERSLFQLLYDNLDDWLNPKWDEQNEQTQQATM